MQVQTNNTTPLAAANDTVALPLPAIVDTLADVQAQIAVLEAREKDLKKALIETGLKEVCGSNVRAVISTSKASVTTSWKDVAAELNPSDELVAKHSKAKDPVTSVKLYGYN